MKKGRGFTKDSRDGSRNDVQKEKGTEEISALLINVQKEQTKNPFHFISKCVQLAQHLQHIVTEELNKNISYNLDLSCICNYSHLKERQNMYLLERQHLKLKQDNCGMETGQEQFTYNSSTV